MSAQTLTIALAGNPNVGKSTIFNALTGSRQHVGNWPGKTVEKKEGRLNLEGQEFVVVDLPGTYSLTAYSIEEIISRDFVVQERPQAVIAVVDSANLERNLYLVTQLLELEVSVILALNMMDIARHRGLTISPTLLSQRLNGAPVIEMVGNSGVGLDSLKAAILSLSRQPVPPPVRLDYGPHLEEALKALESAIQAVPGLAQRYAPRWLAIKLLEGDSAIRQALEAEGHAALLAQAAQAAQAIEDASGEDAETLITDRRYAFVGQLVEGALSRPREGLTTRSDQIDQILTHRLYGLPIFLLLMWIVFQFTANVSAPLLDWVDGLISGPLTRWALALLGAVGLGDTWVQALISDGIIAGVGGVLVFVPVLMTLYIAIGILEDSGYMARAAFVMDRVMRTIGLHGKSFLPMMVGFGCNVPAVYATRTLETAADRRLTAFLVTFMSCGARLPVYAIIGAALFGAQAGNLIFAMYLLGISVALATGWAVKRTLYRNQPPQPFVMELPPYRLPKLRDVWRQTWERTSSFVRKAATIIMGTSIIIWLLMALPASNGGQFNDVEPADSLFGTASRLIAPVFSPLGFGEWEASGALISGFIAKEVIVGTMNQIFVGEVEEEAVPESESTLADDLAEIGGSLWTAGILTVQETVNIVPRTVNILPFVHMPEADFLGQADDEEDTTALQNALARVFTPLSALAFSVFVLLYTPCMAVVAAMRHEFGLRLALYQMAYTFAVAWFAAFIVYQGGLLLGLGA